MKFKEFIKKHKTEIIAIGGVALIVGGIVVVKSRPTDIPAGKTMATFAPNIDNDTVDLLIKLENGKSLWCSFDYGEAPLLAVELNEAIECIRPQG